MEPSLPLPDRRVSTPIPETSPLTRRGFLRGAMLTGGGLIAAGIAACTPTTQAGWTFPPVASAPVAGASASAVPSVAASPVAAAPSASAAASIGPLPAGWAEHDLHARTVIRRYVGNLAPALKGIYGDAAFTKLVDILGAADDYPELKLKPAFAQVPQLALNDILSRSSRSSTAGSRSSGSRSMRSTSTSTSSCRPRRRSATTSSGQARRSG